eukprot:5323620-Alexandrium_andersonii.AAC.1
MRVRRGARVGRKRRWGRQPSRVAGPLLLVVTLKPGDAARSSQAGMMRAFVLQGLVWLALD